MNHVSPAKKELPCPSHPEKQVDLYCETCEEMICRDCIVRVHRDHQYDLVRAAFPKHRLEIEASLEPVQAQLASVNTALDGLDVLCTTINDQRQSLKTEVKSTMRQIHQALEKREEELVLEIEPTRSSKPRLPSETYWSLSPHDCRVVVSLFKRACKQGARTKCWLSRRMLCTKSKR